MILGSVKMQFGKAMKELCEMSTLSSCVHSTISSGKVDIRLFDKFSSGNQEHIRNEASTSNIRFPLG
jgi:hypothetical protein